MLLTAIGVLFLLSIAQCQPCPTMCRCEVAQGTYLNSVQADCVGLGLQCYVDPTAAPTIYDYTPNPTVAPPTPGGIERCCCKYREGRPCFPGFRSSRCASSGYTCVDSGPTTTTTATTTTTTTGTPPTNTPIPMTTTAPPQSTPTNAPPTNPPTTPPTAPPTAPPTNAPTELACVSNFCNPSDAISLGGPVTTTIQDTSKGHSLSAVVDNRCFESGADWGSPNGPTSAKKICDVYAELPIGFALVTASFGLRPANQRSQCGELRSNNCDAFYTAVDSIAPPSSQTQTFVPWSSCGTFFSMGDFSDATPSCPQTAPVSGTTDTLRGANIGIMELSWYCLLPADSPPTVNATTAHTFRLSIDASSDAIAQGVLTLLTRDSSLTDTPKGGIVRSDILIKCFD